MVRIHPGSPLVPLRRSGGGKNREKSDQKNDGYENRHDDRKPVQDRSGLVAIATTGRTKAHFVAANLAHENSDRHDNPLFDHSGTPDLARCLVAHNLANSAAKYRQNDEGR